ncbi:MAG TPA: hypothetical protein VKT77_14400 [Chthonomonadaceae bacterium]|nr:hypothetical protein [Chthonomonadaceae bacterium]
MPIASWGVPMLLLRFCLFALLLLPLGAAVLAQAPSLPGTAPLAGDEDLAKAMVEGIHAYLDRALAASEAGRATFWHRDLTSLERYDASVATNRERLSRMLGVVDHRDSVKMRLDALAGEKTPALAGIGKGYRIERVRWNVFRGVEGEGLLLTPNRSPRADIIALPDCDNTPEQLVGLMPGMQAESQFARRLAGCGCRVLVPALIDRGATYSGNPAVAITNQPHREFLYRAAYEMGRTTTGYEVQKVLAAVDWFQSAGVDAATADGNPRLTSHKPQATSDVPRREIGVIGYGEGGLIALYSGALDTRIQAVAVSSCFGRRERMVHEPIYRNLFGLLREFGDAEIASLIATRALIVEAARAPVVTGPPKEGRPTAASGTLDPYPIGDVRAELDRARALTAGLRDGGSAELVVSGDGSGPPGCPALVRELLSCLSVPNGFIPGGGAPKPVGPPFDTEARRKRQFYQIAEDTQVLMREAPLRRRETWARADFTSGDSLARTSGALREAFWDEIVGKLPEPTLPPNPKSRKIYETDKLTGYEVKLDLYPDVFAYGILLVPKGIPAGDRRPVVVCQHGLEGRSQDVADPAMDNPAYHAYAARLAERGYITFAPQNPYIGVDRFRTALRKAQPLKLTLFSFIVRQHEAILKWLAAQPNVDPARIAFYGLSYGGKTGMRVPALLPGYCLSICSGDYNEWVWKCSALDSPYSYLYTFEYDMPEWNLANTFNYAEMSWLICPRPFMVERGHRDGVAPDEWVSYEYARTRRVYDQMGLADRTELEIFDGPHTIHGVGTFAFLDRFLKRN